MRVSPVRRLARLAVAVLVALVCNGLIVAFLLAVNARESTAPAPPWRPLEVGVIVPPAQDVEPEPQESPPESKPEVAPREDLPAPAPAPPEWTPPDVRAPAGTTLDLAVDVAIADGFRVQPVTVPVAPAPAPVATDEVLPDILELWQVDRPPELLSGPAPGFPGRALRRGIEGRVVVRFVVGLDGRVQTPEVVEAKPRGYFEADALRVIQRWRFRPAQYRGKPVKCRTRQAFTFKWKRRGG